MRGAQEAADILDARKRHRTRGILTVANPQTPSDTGAGRGKRPEVQGLRAIAVLLVVGYHLWPNRVVGGFVGVDIFFVISGFLITSHLVREVRETGTIRVGAFWMRRARRLLPASLLVLGAVAIGTFILAPVTHWRQYFEEISASALYVQNWLLSANSVDYLASTNDPSPVQHYWSLSVEEQFYVALPMVILVLITVLRLLRRQTHALASVVVLLGVVTAASLAFSIVDTATDPSSAYFVSTTRWWEFGVGALISFVPAVPGRRVRLLVSSVGFALILVAAAMITAALPFPGWLATIPVAGTALTLWAGRSGYRFELANVVSARPFQWVGDYSYSIYLWHWPLVVLVPFATGHDLRTLDKVIIVVAALALAWLSTKFVENPIRFAPPGGIRRSPKFLVPAIAASMALLVATSSISIGQLDAASARTKDALAAIQTGGLPCFGAQAVEPDGTVCANPSLDGQLVPAADAFDKDDGNEAACWSTNGESTLRVCSFGPADAKVRVFAVGDSHNNSLIPAYAELAKDLGWRVDVAGKGGCYWTDGPQRFGGPGLEEQCDEWLRSVDTRLAASAPYDVIIATHRADVSPAKPGVEAYHAGIVSGLQAAWSTQLSRGSRIVAVRDVPVPPRTLTDCVARQQLAAADKCAFPRSTALSYFDGQSEAAKGLAGATVLDLSNVFCDASTCRPVLGNAVVYRDSSGHVTGTFAATLAPRLESALESALRQPEPSAK